MAVLLDRAVVFGFRKGMRMLDVHALGRKVRMHVHHIVLDQ